MKKFLNKFIKKQNLQRGFSLLEVLVALSIFIVVIVMSVGALLVLVDANAKAQNNQKIMSSMSFALDSMTREIRTGSGFICSSSDISPSTSELTTQDCSSGTYLSIVEGGESLTGSLSGNRITYRYNATDKKIERRLADGSWYPLTNTNISVDAMHFSVTNSTRLSSNDEKQAIVSLYIEGSAEGVNTTNTSFTIQTSISRRILDI